MQKPQEIDARSINARLLAQVSRVLDDLEGEALIGPKDRVMALVAIGRIQVIFNTLRKSSGDVESGSAVRRYSKAFSQNDARRRTKTGRRAAALDTLDAIEDDDTDAA
jgi:hypothetical protein